MARGLHLGQRPTTTTGGGASNRVTFTVVDDVVYLTDPVTGYTFEAPVTFVGPTTLPSGLITAEPDTLLFHYAGGTWSSPATQVEGTAPVGGTILNDTFYVTIASVTYAMPVTATEGIPGMPPGGETSLVVIDDVEYLRIVFPDGEVRYEEVHEIPTPDAAGGSGTPASDLPYDPVLWDGNLNAATKNVLRDKFESLGIPISVKSFGALGDGTTPDAPAIQDAIDSLAVLGGTLYFPAGHYLTAPLTCPHDNIHFVGDGTGASIIQFDDLEGDPGVGLTGLAITGNGCSLARLSVQGPGSEAAYVGNQRLISCLGASNASRIEGLTITDCSLSGSGAYAVDCRYANNVIITRSVVSDCAYCAFLFYSCTTIDCSRNKIDVLNAVGFSANAYGIALGQENDVADPGWGEPTANEPFCNDVLIEGNSIRGPKIWEAIDAHGLFNGRILGNYTHAARTGIYVPTGSGADINFSGYSVLVQGNVVDKRDIDGTDASVLDGGHGIVIQGGTSAAKRGASVVGNIIRRYGRGTGGFQDCSIYVGIDVCWASVASNVIEDWAGFGIFVANRCFGIAISGNTFGNTQDEVTGDGGTLNTASCIYVGGAATAKIAISGNVHSPNSTFRAQYGIQVAADVVNGSIVAAGNNFLACVSQQQMTGSQILGFIYTAAGFQIVPTGYLQIQGESGSANNGLIYLGSGGNYIYGIAAGLYFRAASTDVFRLTSAGAVVTGTLTVTDDAYNPSSWDGNLSVPTKNAVRDKIESLAPGIIGFTASDTSVATGKVKGFVTCPYAATISGWSIVVDAGTATVKVWKIASGTAKPTVANVINTSGVAIASGTAVISTTVTDFTTLAVAANDIFAFDITAASGVAELTFQLKLTKS